MSHFIIGQIIGCIALGFSLGVYQVNKRPKMLLFSTIAATLYALSCLFLHAYTGAALDMLAAIRCYEFYRSKNAKHSVKVYMLFTAIAILATAVTWSGPISLLPLVGTMLSGYASSQRKPQRIRRFALTSIPFWLSYAVLIHSYPATIMNIVVLCSNLLGQYRFDHKRTTHTVHHLRLLHLTR
jgi:hypothetical protein